MYGIRHPNWKISRQRCFPKQTPHLERKLEFSPGRYEGGAFKDADADTTGSSDLSGLGPGEPSFSNLTSLGEELRVRVDRWLLYGRECFSNGSMHC
jgi:hypothetical protein